jgi:ABC-type multidrug transport system fused ATPase/permease subunit
LSSWQNWVAAFGSGILMLALGLFICARSWRTAAAMICDASVPVIEALDLSVTYCLPRNPTKSAQEFTVRALKRQIQYEDPVALRNVSFELAPASPLSVIGANEAGESTLLKLVARARYRRTFTVRTRAVALEHRRPPRRRRCR